MKHFPSVYLMLIICSPLTCQRLVPPGKILATEDDDDHPNYNDALDEEEYISFNHTDEKGLYVGAPCEFTCSPKLIHAYCNAVSGTCECEKKYPVRLNNLYAGCTKPKRLGDQCYYNEACQYTDQHAACAQIHHNAVCQCQAGYHSVSVQKPSKRVFCAEDVVVLASDFSTFAGVLSGIAVLSGLICFVLYLFNQNLYESHHRHRFGNANLAPPILFASDPGSLPLPMMAYERSVTVTTASRASSAHRSYTGSMGSRRASSAPGFRSGAITMSRAGSRRPSIASVHSVSSIRSYSARRYEKERQQREEREMDRRYSKLSRANSTSRVAPTPSPHSTDDLLPTLEEDKQIPPLAAKEESTTSFPEEIPSTSKQFP